MKIYPIPISDLQFVESGEFVVRFLTDFDNQNHDATQDVEIKYFYDTLKAQSPIFNKALMPIRAKAESQELLTLDTIRDQKIQTLRRAYDVFEYAEDDNEKQAYSGLAPLFTTYKNVAKMNFEAESLAVDNMVADLNSSTYKSHVSSLNLVAHVGRIETANAAFKGKFTQRSSIRINEEEYNAKQLRRDIFEVYKDTVQYVQVMAKRKKTPYYIDMLKTINDSREYYANILAKRNGTQDAPLK